ncbi:long-subunit acyl-CoA synthetase (AMP-forming) [Streptomyces canus]|uniref:hypothetical protein n=1 Tax=Streptomyces canus TaxID=58343 RepID=UPI0027829F9E|nr:hypothetical protein [Streptomyces canus]MDQ0601615.1 long-subunit acyl-CoA synthetase (AMP-forming) [Streptomyces canus]
MNRAKQRTDLADRVRIEVVKDAQGVVREESIRQFRLVEGEFNEGSGLLTPSMKIKRHAVTAAYAEEIEALHHS